jgi:hypothetical protein
MRVLSLLFLGISFAFLFSGLVPVSEGNEIPERAWALINRELASAWFMGAAIWAAAMEAANG